MDMECRICYEVDHQSNLIQPCKCTGTQKYVHGYCLNKWRMRHNETEKSFHHCNECNYKYDLKFIYELETWTPKLYHRGKAFIFDYCIAQCFIIIMAYLTKIQILYPTHSNFFNQYDSISFLFWEFIFLSTTTHMFLKTKNKKKYIQFAFLKIFSLHLLNFHYFFSYFLISYIFGSNFIYFDFFLSLINHFILIFLQKNHKKIKKKINTQNYLVVANNIEV